MVIPRCIGWISTIGRNGVVNLAPYSFFNAIAAQPPFVMFASATRQGFASATLRRPANSFTVSRPSSSAIEMNITSSGLAPGISEPELAELEMATSLAVKPPRVKKSPIALECEYSQTLKLPGPGGKPHSFAVVIGEVVSIYIDDAIIVNGVIDVAKVQPIARLGYLSRVRRRHRRDDLQNAASGLNEQRS